MNTPDNSPALVWSQRKIAFLSALLGSMPLSIGRKLRQFFYRPLFAHMGTSVTIQPGVSLAGTHAIELGNNVTLGSGVHLNCWDPNGRMVLRDGVSFDRDIDVKVHEDGYVDIGESTYLGPFVCMAGPGHIKIGRNCMIASHCGIYANNHQFADCDRPINSQNVTKKGIVIEEDCWLGSGVKVLDGVTVGQGSVIGAGSVVTKNIPPYSIAVGTPARVIKKRGEAGIQEELKAIQHAKALEPLESP